jgi:hypothetical protein
MPRNSLRIGEIGPRRRAAAKLRVLGSAGQTASHITGAGKGRRRTHGDNFPGKTYEC